MAWAERADFPIVGEQCTVDLARWPGRGETLEQWDDLGVTLQGRFLNRLKRLATVGYLRHPNEIEEIGDRIYELKVMGNWRAAAFEDSQTRTWYITHFFKTRHNSRSVRSAQSRAQEARAAHYSRTEGTP